MYLTLLKESQRVSQWTFHASVCCIFEAKAHHRMKEKEGKKEERSIVF